MVKMKTQKQECEACAMTVWQCRGLREVQRGRHGVKVIGGGWAFETEQKVGKDAFGETWAL